MKYSFSKDSTNLIITLDTESGKYAPEVTSLNDPNITLENGSFWIYENGQFLRFLSFDQISTIDGVIPSNVDDAFTKINTILNTLHLLASPKFKGTAVPTDTPTGTEDAFWIATQAGTYTNFGGVVVSANSRAEISRVSGVFTISQTPLDITSKVNVSDVINTLVSAETAKPLSAAQGKALNEKFIPVDAKLMGRNLEVINASVISQENLTVTIGATGTLSVVKLNSKVYPFLRIASTKIKFTLTSTAYFIVAGDASTVITFGMGAGGLSGVVNRWNSTTDSSSLVASSSTPTIAVGSIVEAILENGIVSIYDDGVLNKTFNIGALTQPEYAKPCFGFIVHTPLTVASNVNAIVTDQVSYLSNKIAEIEPKISSLYTLDESIASENIYNIADITDGYSVGTTGALTINASFFVTGFMKVLPSTQYYLSSGSYRTYCYYNSSQTVISGGSDMNGLRTFTTPSTAAFIKISVTKFNNPSYNFICRKGSLELGYVPFGNTTLRLETERFKTALAGKTLVSDGDSICQMARWQFSILDKIPMIHINKGIGGTTLTGSGTTNITSPERLALLPAGDIYILNGGMNDWRNNLPIGTYGDTANNTVYGALKVYTDYILTNFPSAQIILNTVPFAMLNSSSIVNAGGKTTRDYSNAIIEHCQKNNIKYADVNANCGWNAINIATYVDLEVDGSYIHPNLAGGKRMAGVILREISKII